MTAAPPFIAGSPTVDAWTPSADQDEVTKLLRDVMQAYSAEADVRRAMDTGEGTDRGLWRRLGDLGVLGMGVPEEYGGGGATQVEVSLAAEELGRALACVPFFASTVLAQTAILASDNSAARERWLPELAAGAVIGAGALIETGTSWDGSGGIASATREDGQWIISGTKVAVVDGHVADLFVVLARCLDGTIGLWLVEGQEGVVRTPSRVMDQTRRLAEIRFNSVPGELLATGVEAETSVSEMLDIGCISLAAESAGGAQRVLELALDHARNRFQFGRAIGSFQAIKHKCADMLIQVEAANSAMSYARQVLSRPGPAADLALAASVAKSACADAYVFCANENIQVHGGMGFTWEHPAHLYFKRARTNQVLMGDPYQHRARIGDLLGI